MQTIPQAAILTLIAGSTFQSPARAQDAASADEPKHQQVIIIDPSQDHLPTMGTNQTPIEPTASGVSTPHQTGLTQGQDWMQVVNNTIGSVTKPSALAEGSFVLARTGRLVPAPNDRIIFVPAPDQRLPGEGPVLLLPCATLQSLENVWANQPVTVSGEILTYHGRNQLLISDYSLGLTEARQSSPQKPDDQQTDPEDQQEQPILPDSSPEEPKPGLDEDPDVMDLLKELDAENDTYPGSEAQDQISKPRNSRLKGQQSNQLQIAPPTLGPGLREGTLLVRRPARLDRAADGSWMVIFDNDDQTSPGGIELTVLPCSLLMTMERQAIQFGDNARFVVSGRMYIHNGRGYLLPTFYQRLRTSDIKPWQ
ncbi:MAG: hypothetical protein JKY43_04930 [Phycisphaerales bacterium]|nr:hypothetical protein [Phycisphaerales bacterium]